MEQDPVINAVLAAYPDDCQPEQIQSLGNGGGFSGARLWRLQTRRGELCLRCWPRGQTTDRLTYVHGVLQAAAARGIATIPAPISSGTGTFVVQSRCLWELTKWLPGEATYHKLSSPTRLASAMRTLARFHSAVQPAKPSVPKPPVAVHRRLALIDRLNRSDRREIQQRLRFMPSSEFGALAHEIIPLFDSANGFVQHQLSAFQTVPSLHQPCIRDIWHDHVLFTGDEVTGIVDFGAMQHDIVEADLARLVGSLAGDDQQQWEAGLNEYTRVRGLTMGQQELCRVLDRANVLLSGMNWLRWIVLEDRQFETPAAILQRLIGIRDRLRQLCHLAATES